ncbi:MAG: hypothetical protein U0Q11_06665 [Vicinamibacterales bacterium]
MKALYKNRICYVMDVSSDVTLIEGETRFVVSLADEALVLDPTDGEVADACNLAEWSGRDGEAVIRYRQFLRGELPSSEC